MSFEHQPGFVSNLASNRRKGKRTLLYLPALVVTSQDRCIAQLLDLSPDGAMLRIGTCLKAGDSVIFTCGELERPATVKWQRGWMIGVKFSEPLAAEQLTRQLDRSKAVEAFREGRILVDVPKRVSSS